MSTYNNYGYTSLVDMQVAMNLVPDGIWGSKSAAADKLLGDLADEALLVRRELIAHDFNMDDMKDRAMCSAIQEVLALSGYSLQLEYSRYGADGHWGNCSNAALGAYMNYSGITSKDEAITALGQYLLSLYPNDYLSSLLSNESGTSSDATFQIRNYVRSDRNRVEVSDGIHTKEFTYFKKGVYTSGILSLHQALTDDEELAALCNDLSAGTKEVLSVISLMEGKLDAINTWDNAFLSNGMFQWTVGTGSNAGELGALLKLFKRTYPEKYQEYFGKYGLQPLESSINVDVAPLALFGDVLDSSSKEKLRTPEWAFIFWKAAYACPEYQHCQIMHAASRIKKALSLTVEGVRIRDIFTSEESVAQCLQIHVNRPAYLSDLIKRSIKSLFGTDTATYVKKYDPANKSEHQINLMVEIEKDSHTYGKYPLTHPDVRFGTVRRERLNDAAHSYK
ncbi:putative LysM peptidoglycan-binding domain-containing protein [Vibrio phage 150E35-1]|nr:putative LysM peptidoglycan-binding domain-containing protein [Vibrio phage 150E35-1]